MVSRAKKVQSKEAVKVDMLTKKILYQMELGDKVLVYNSPLDLSIIIEKACEIKTFHGREVVYDLKKFIVSDDGVNKPFRCMEFTDIDTIKKYVSSLQQSRLNREVKYVKLLMQKNIRIGDVVKRSVKSGSSLLVVQPFQDTQADRFVVNCLKLDKNNRITKEDVRVEIKNLRRMKSIKIKK